MPRYVTQGSPAFLDDFGDLLPDTVRIASPTAPLDAYGDPIANTLEDFSARVMHKSSARRDVNSVEFVSPLQVIIAGCEQVALDARVTLPDGTVHIVRDSETFRDEHNRPHHVTVYFAS